MSVTNLSINGNNYALMKSTLKRPKVSERWFAICPMKGDGKWFAKTEEDLIARLKEEEGGVKAVTFKPKKPILWSSEGEYNGKPIIKWYTDGTMDVDTPTARFRIEMAPVNHRGLVSNILPVSDDCFDTFCDELVEVNEAGYIRGILTKIRLKNPDGSTLRDIEVEDTVLEDGSVSPMALLDSYVDDILENESNDLVSFIYAFREDPDGDDRVDVIHSLSAPIIEEAHAVFLVIDAMKFIDSNCDDGVASSEGNCHHQNSNLSTEDAREVLVKIQSVATALSSIL